MTRFRNRNPQNSSDSDNHQHGDSPIDILDDTLVHITDESMTSSDEDDLFDPDTDSGQDDDDNDVDGDCDDSTDTRGDWGVHSAHGDHVLRRLELNTFRPQDEPSGQALRYDFWPSRRHPADTLSKAFSTKSH
ncbi:MAG: hypothetical protein M1840_008504 [Geoglossum simile]|nr:MAG: hypothetical protein M1840_008504 [Geoglossum simile]